MLCSHTIGSDVFLLESLSNQFALLTDCFVHQAMK